MTESTAAQRTHRNTSRSVTADAGVTGVAAAPVQLTSGLPIGSERHSTDGRGSAFERLRGDRVLSNWKPSVTDVDCEPIPDFLRRGKSAEPANEPVTVEPVVADELPAERPAFRRPYG